ncbi:eukaryotic glutathione synthase [Endogone sp. FLAS-F59071]|nr:eukaryotic glutathione synthase [Endogone sp. FLAS-F59071]|eukprot:RUS19111.1 eukaryotic glutathione synthase [Endogone sp. FLAS-F59071]
MSTPYPPALSPSQLTSLLDLAIDWSLAHGLVVRPKQAHLANNAAVTHAPYSLFPSRYPRSAFDQAVRLQPIWNELIHKISEDEAFLGEIMTDLSQIDDFVGNLYDIYLAVRREGIAQPVSLGLHRCDYLLHVPLDSNLATTIPVIQQVEFNTISSSFGSLSTLTGQMHRYLLAATNYYVEPGNIIAEQLPENESIKSIAKGIAKAWESLKEAREARDYWLSLFYGYINAKQLIATICIHLKHMDGSAITLMVVQPNERNAFDQRWIEYNLLEKLGPFHLSFLTSDVGELELQFFYTHSASSSRPNSHHVRLIRRTLAEIAELASLDPETKALIMWV